MRFGSRLAPVAAIVLLACAPKPPPTSIGPAGGLVASEDDGLTLVLWPGALGEFHDFEIRASDRAPESFGPAYEITPNPELGIDAEIILRGDLPDPTSLARVGAIDDADGMTWRALPLDPGGINPNDDTVRGHDDRVSRFYAMLDEGGDVGTTTDATTSETSDTGDPTGPPLSFAVDVQPILTEHCTLTNSCHGAAPSGDLSLDMDAYENIVGVQAVINGSFTLVIPGDSENSLMMNKIDRAPPNGAGLPMPPGGPLPDGLPDLIRSWIDQGCPP